VNQWRRVAIVAADEKVGRAARGDEIGIGLTQVTEYQLGHQLAKSGPGMQEASNERGVGRIKVGPNWKEREPGFFDAHSVIRRCRKPALMSTTLHFKRKRNLRVQITKRAEGVEDDRSQGQFLI
jgi:hypothetical protein